MPPFEMSQFKEVGCVHVPCDITIEAGTVEGGDRGPFASDRLEEVHETLVDQPISTDVRTNLLHCSPIGDEFLHGGHIDAIHVRVANRRGGRGEEDLRSTHLLRHLHDLGTRRTTDDRIVHEQNVLALEFVWDGIQLPADGSCSKGLTRHDEGSSDVSILHESLPVGNTEFPCQLQRSDASAVWDGDDTVDSFTIPRGGDAFCEHPTHVQSGLVDRDPVDHGIRTCEVDMLEDAGAWSTSSAHIDSNMWPESEMKIPSPGRTSRTMSNPSAVKATDSDATTHS